MDQAIFQQTLITPVGLLKEIVASNTIGCRPSIGLNVVVDFKHLVFC